MVHLAPRFTSLLAFCVLVSAIPAPLEGSPEVIISLQKQPCSTSSSTDRTPTITTSSTTESPSPTMEARRFLRARTHKARSDDGRYHPGYPTTSFNNGMYTPYTDSSEPTASPSPTDSTYTDDGQYNPTTTSNNGLYNPLGVVAPTDPSDPSSTTTQTSPFPSANLVSPSPASAISTVMSAASGVPAIINNILPVNPATATTTATGAAASTPTPTDTATNTATSTATGTDTATGAAATDTATDTGIVTGAAATDTATTVTGAAANALGAVTGTLGSIARKRYDDGQYHPNPAYDDGQYHPEKYIFDDGQYHPNPAFDNGQYHGSKRHESGMFHPNSKNYKDKRYDDGKYHPDKYANGGKRVVVA